MHEVPQYIKKRIITSPIYKGALYLYHGVEIVVWQNRWKDIERYNAVYYLPDQVEFSDFSNYYDMVRIIRGRIDKYINLD